MEEGSIHKKTDHELVRDAGEVVIGTPSGLRAQHAQAELVRRNTEALKESSRTSEKYSDVMIVFSLLLFFVAMLQLVATFFASDKPWYVAFILTVFFLGCIALVMKIAFKWFDKKHKKNKK